MRLILLSTLIISPFFVQAQTDICLKKCSKYQIALKAGKKHIDTEPKRYSKAIFEFLAAETAARECDCDGKEINKYIRAAIDGLEAEKEAAIAAKEAEERAKNAAEEAERKARLAESIALQERAETQEALTLLKVEQDRTSMAIIQIEIEKNKALEAKNRALEAEINIKQEQTYTVAALTNVEFLNNKNEKLINAFYFYKDKYALAYNNNQFYFINKDGEAISKLGKWDKAENFNPATGLAKVTPTGQIFSQYIDTLNNKYPIAYRIPFRDNKKFYKAYEVKFNRHRFCFPKKILKNDEIVLLELKGSKIKKIPSKIGNLKDLKAMDFSNNRLKTLPKEIGKLSNLTILNLSYNSLSALPETIKKLNKLEKLILINNNFSDNERKKIENWLPNCEITW